MELWLIAVLIVIGAIMRKAIMNAVRKQGLDEGLARCGLTWFLMIGFQLVALMLYFDLSMFGIEKALLFLLLGMNIELPQIKRSKT